MGFLELDLFNTKNSSNVVALQYVVDGNFTTQHMKMRKPEDDVALSDGLAYMVTNGHTRSMFLKLQIIKRYVDLLNLSHGWEYSAHTLFSEIIMSEP